MRSQDWDSDQLRPVQPPRDPGLLWPWFPPLPSTTWDRQRETGAGRKAVGSRICCPSPGVQGARPALTGSGVPAPLSSTGWGRAQRLLWADTPRLDTTHHGLLLPLAPITPLNSMPTQLLYTGLLLTVLGVEAQSPHSPHRLAPHFLRWLSRRVPQSLAKGHKVSHPPSLLCPLCTSFLLGLLTLLPAPSLT